MAELVTPDVAPDFPTEGEVVGTEVVVYDRDDAGNVIGWHKEAQA